jgi:hypothetical protein
MLSRYEVAVSFTRLFLLDNFLTGRLILAFFLAFATAPCPASAGMGQEALQRLWNYFASLHLRQDTGLPGRVVGQSAELTAFFFQSRWAHRQTTYELYFAEPEELARSVYSLALASGDITPDMPRDRFEKGVRGFHYSMEQVRRWADGVLADEISLPRSERAFWDMLVADAVLSIADGKTVGSATITHILGAASGRRRRFIDNLRHERLHVLWDESPDFSLDAAARWAEMREEDKQEVFSSLSAYSTERESQIMEEWAVRQAERHPETTWRDLTGL